MHAVLHASRYSLFKIRTSCSPICLGVAHARPPEAYPQGRVPRGASHTLLARDQSHAEGNADGRRPAGHPTRGRRGARSRHRAFRLRDRAQQAVDRGPFRPASRSSSDARGARQDQGAGGARGGAARGRRRRASPASRRRWPGPCGLVRARIVGDEPFALLLPDMLHHGGKGCLAEMIEASTSTAATTSPYRPCPRADPPVRHRRRRGREGQSFAHHADGGKAGAGHGAVQPAHHRPLHPAAGDLRPARQAGARRGGEIQLTDAMIALLKAGKPFHAVRFDGTIYDTGSKIGFLLANVAYALERDDLAPALKAGIANSCRRAVRCRPVQWRKRTPACTSSTS